MIELLDDTDSFKFIIDFLALSLKKSPTSAENTNSEKWVRNQAM